MAGQKQNQADKNFRSLLRDAAETNLSASLYKATWLKDRTLEEIIHELKVHQVELEMQNGELKRTLEDLEEAKDKYLDLYDFAPVGYLTISAKGVIVDANNTAANMLGMERGKLPSHGFALFMPSKEITTWEHFLVNIFHDYEKHNCDLLLNKQDGSTFYALIMGTMLKSGAETKMARIAISDITDKKLIDFKLKEEKKIMEKIVAISQEFLQSVGSELNYEKITDNILDISGAKYAGLNLYDEEGSKSITVAFSAPETILKKVSSLLGFKLVGKKWDHDPVHTEKIKSHAITHFSTLSEIAGDLIAKPLASLLEKTFNFGEVVIVKIFKENIILGDFTLIMPRNVKFKNDNYVEIYSQQVGLMVASKKATEALKDSEERYHKLFETIDEGVVLIDPDGQIIQANSKAEHFLGLTLSEIKSRKYDSPAWDIIRPDGTPMPPEEMAGPCAMMEKRSVKDVTMGAKHPDGSVSWGNVSAEPLLNEAGELYGVVSTCRDITDHKIAEEQILFQSHLLANVSEAIIATDINYNIIFWNKIAEKLYGWKAEEVTGYPLEKFIVNGYIDCSLEIVLRGISQNGYWRGEVTQNRHDGVRIPIMSTVSVIKNDKNQPTGFISINRDIAGRKKREQEVIELSRFPSEDPNPIMRMDYEGRILYSNQACKILPGWKQKDGSIIKNTFLEQIFKLVESKSGKISYKMIKFGNKTYKLTIINIKEYSYANIYLENITEKVNAEKAVRKSMKEKEFIASVERIRMEREIHDSLSQTIFSTYLLADSIPDLWNKNRQEALKQLEKIKLLTKESEHQFRRILLEIKKDAFLFEDLGDLIRQLAYSLQLRSEIPVEVNIKGKHNYSKEITEAFYRICQEALNNIIKYSCASMVKIELECLPEKIFLIIKDNGVGFDKKKISKKSLGLFIMGKRAKDIKATLNIDSKIGRGTKITVKL